MIFNSKSLARSVSALAVVLIVSLFISAHAAKKEPVDPCASAIKQHCSTTKPGPETTECLLKVKKLPQGCTPVSWNNCTENLKVFCKDVKPGEGRIVTCLNDKYNQLSEECRRALNFLNPGSKELGPKGTDAKNAPAPDGKSQNTTPEKK